jgi:hypothetical protein
VVKNTVAPCFTPNELLATKRQQKFIRGGKLLMPAPTRTTPKPSPALTGGVVELKMLLVPHSNQAQVAFPLGTNMALSIMLETPFGHAACVKTAGKVCARKTPLAANKMNKETNILRWGWDFSINLTITEFSVFRRFIIEYKQTSALAWPKYHP